MPEPSEEPAAPVSAAKPRRRWLQISLRTLLLLIALVAMAALSASWYEAPFRRQRAAMAAIEQAGGSYYAAPGGPAWLRRMFGEDAFRNITLVNIAACDDPLAYIDHVAGLPAIETLVVGGSAFTDEHLKRLHGLTTLSGLVLDCTEVTDEGLAALGNALPSLEIYQSERRAIVALSKLGGSLQTKTNFDHPRIEKLVGRQWFDEALHLSFRQAGFSNSAPFGQCRDADLALLKKLTRLRTLLLDNVPITDAGLEHLAGLKRLQSLALQRLPDVGDAGLAHLGGLTQLTQLSLAWTNVGDAGLPSLRGMTRLTSLGLGGTCVTDAGLVHLQAFHQLDTLHLDEARVGDAGLAHLKGLPLKTLRLRRTRVGDAGLAHLAELQELGILELDRTRITDAGTAHLGRLPQLVFLQMSQTQIGDAGLASLKGLGQLQTLRVDGTQVTDGGLKHVMGLKNLAELMVPERVTAAAIRELKLALPNCNIR